MAVLYEVSVKITPAFAGDFEEYMARTHIPAVLATGCFSAAVFSRRAEGEYRTSYRAAGREELDRYLREFAAELRADFLEHFADAEVSRAEFEELTLLDAGELTTRGER